MFILTWISEIQALLVVVPLSSYLQTFVLAFISLSRITAIGVCRKRRDDYGHACVTFPGSYRGSCMCARAKA